jgi:crotonobetainyl-CoA:carnitine CoA-transferase CaiB-like acyl-CoA transferase
MNKPLAGIRVIDLTHMLSGPYCAMILADLGAETIKVEPLQGEGTRKLLASDPKNSLDGMGAYYITLNRNKQSVCIDLKSDEGRQVFYDLVKESDVVVNNFGAGVPARLGIDYNSLSAINPKIIPAALPVLVIMALSLSARRLTKLHKQPVAVCRLPVLIKTTPCVQVFLLVI